VLSFLTVTATADLSPAATPSIAALHATLSVAEVKLGTTPARINVLAGAKRITAEVQDGPEGEEEPVAGLVRAYDGDDQIETRCDFATIAFHVVVCAPSFRGAAPALSHAPCAGFPTGPPTA
jgi:hypothetical protein